MNKTATAFARLIKELLHGDMSRKELAEESGLYITTVVEYTKAMHREGVVHVCRWEPDARGKHSIPIYKLGKGKDAPRIRMTAAERQAKYRAKIRQLKLMRALTGVAK